MQTSANLVDLEKCCKMSTVVPNFKNWLRCCQERAPISCSRVLSWDRYSPLSVLSLFAASLLYARGAALGVNLCPIYTLISYMKTDGGFNSTTVLFSHKHEVSKLLQLAPLPAVIASPPCNLENAISTDGQLDSRLLSHQTRCAAGPTRCKRVKIL